MIINLLIGKKASNFVKYYKPRDLNLVLENKVTVLCQSASIHHFIINGYSRKKTREDLWWYTK